MQRGPVSLCVAMAEGGMATAMAEGGMATASIARKQVSNLERLEI